MRILVPFRFIWSLRAFSQKIGQGPGSSRNLLERNGRLPLWGFEGCRELLQGSEFGCSSCEAQGFRGLVLEHANPNLEPTLDLDMITGLFEHLLPYLWLARNEGMDPHSLIVVPIYTIVVVAMFFSIPSFPANQRQDSDAAGRLLSTLTRLTHTIALDCHAPSPFGTLF